MEQICKINSSEKRIKRIIDELERCKKEGISFIYKEKLIVFLAKKINVNRVTLYRNKKYFKLINKYFYENLNASNDFDKNDISYIKEELRIEKEQKEYLKKEVEILNNIIKNNFELKSLSSQNIDVKNKDIISERSYNYALQCIALLLEYSKEYLVLDKDKQVISESMGFLGESEIVVNSHVMDNIIDDLVRIQ